MFVEDLILFNFTVKFIFWYFIYLRYFFAIYMYEPGIRIFSFKVLKTWLKLIDEKKDCKSACS